MILLQSRTTMHRHILRILPVSLHADRGTKWYLYHTKGVANLCLANAAAKKTHAMDDSSAGSASNAAGRLKTAAIDPARSPVTNVDLESAPRPPASPRGPSYSKSRLRPPRGMVRQKKEKISPVRLLPRRLFHLGSVGSTSYIAARSS